ncbi:bifunctional pinoresinol-lariciresinol reductase [Trichoderma asperellum]|uniref:Bifunctional pinoresinol-lariciresinol reductase n=1 Tax=Trichoderma asperellum TaxID=101201 RepID=A0A6V8QTE5_TRIAP|nr:NAD(P)-binding protein [Trichoderma asperelloides]GFP55867.1 bifunctional pinoresinol-lariciresinol reductase [Trichoderma asperellum]
MAPSVLVIGAGGAFGRPLIEEFIKQKPLFSRVGILSDPAKVSKFSDFAAQGVEVISGSFLDPKPYEGFEVVVSVVGNSIMRLQPAMVEAAITAGVRHFYPSEFGSDVGQESLRTFRYLRDKRVTRDHLAAKAKEHPEFYYTLMLTGIFTEWTADPFYNVDVVAHTATPYGYPDKPLHVTSIPDIARYTVESTLLPLTPGVQKRDIRVVGEKTTFQKFIDDLGEVQGVKYKLTYLDPAEAAANQREAWIRGDEATELMWSVKPMAASGVAMVPGQLDNDKFSFRPESVKDTMKRLYGQ